MSIQQKSPHFAPPHSLTFSRECKSCRYFVVKQQNKDGGHCRIDPPTTHVVGGMIKTEFPAVWNSWWCGQWRGKE